MKLNSLFTLLLTLFTLNAINAQIGWVGNRFPDSGTVVEGAGFTIYVQVYKAGVTEPMGPGAGIDCEIYYGEVGAFGGVWSNISSVSMTYNVDIGNNDEYMGVLNLTAGLYEYKCRCTDDGGANWLYDDESNGQLTVDAATPVTLSHFEARLRNQQVSLEWVTESEEDNKHFEVERSTDLIRWTQLSVVEGGGSTSSRTSYQTIDDDPAQGTNYYRLKQVDYDGGFEYSSIVQLRYDEQPVVLFPNPVSDVLTVRTTRNSAIQIRLYNQLGRLLLSRTFDRDSEMELDMHHFPKGIYLIELTDSYGWPLKTEKVIKN